MFVTCRAGYYRQLEQHSEIITYIHLSCSRCDITSRELDVTGDDADIDRSQPRCRIISSVIFPQ